MPNQADASPAPTDWAERADEAARSVTRLFGQRLFFLPGTHIAATVRPSGRMRISAGPGTTGGRRTTSTAWWTRVCANWARAAGSRESSTAEPGPAPGRLASRLVTGIRLRNFLTFVNPYYDDMAWLALATLRLERLAGGPGPAPDGTQGSCRA